MQHVINFYSLRAPFGCFSNFSAHPVTMGGLVFPTSEHYFQAVKFEGTPHFEVVRLTATAKQAADMGRDRKLPLRPDWNAIKDRVMHVVVLAKFTQHEDLKATLLSTGDAKLVEHTRNDSYWGDGGDGSGENKLGLTLMAVRDEILRASNSHVTGPAADKPVFGDFGDGTPSAKRVKK